MGGRGPQSITRMGTEAKDSGDWATCCGAWHYRPKYVFVFQITRLTVSAVIVSENASNIQTPKMPFSTHDERERECESSVLI